MDFHRPFQTQTAAPASKGPLLRRTISQEVIQCALASILPVQGRG